MTLTPERISELKELAGKAPYAGPWFVEVNPTSVWVGTPKGIPPNQKCDDVFFGQNLTDYRAEYVNRTLDLYRYIAAIDPATLTSILEEIEGLRAALEWYAEQARLCRLIHSEGDAGRHALSADGGKRARNALDGATP